MVVLNWWRKADDIRVHCADWIDNRMEYFSQCPAPPVERTVGVAVARYGMHRVDLTGAFQGRVVGTAHTWLMAVNSSLHR